MFMIPFYQKFVNTFLVYFLFFYYFLFLEENLLFNDFLIYFYYFIEFSRNP